MAHVNASMNMSKRAWVDEFAYSTPQQYVAAMAGIKLSHLVKLKDFEKYIINNNEMGE
jgi:hypothetical protein